jgi:hypothetical protein
MRARVRRKHGSRARRRSGRAQPRGSRRRSTSSTIDDERRDATVRLDIRNSRIEDFHDVWARARAFAFDGFSLQCAVAACFGRRSTTWTSARPLLRRRTGPDRRRDCEWVVTSSRPGRTLRPERVRVRQDASGMPGSLRLAVGRRHVRVVRRVPAR